jgi:hypothetical protein
MLKHLRAALRLTVAAVSTLSVSGGAQNRARALFGGRLLLLRYPFAAVRQAAAAPPRPGA